MFECGPVSSSSSLGCESPFTLLERFNDLFYEDSGRSYWRSTAKPSNEIKKADDRSRSSKSKGVSSSTKQQTTIASKTTRYYQPEESRDDSRDATEETREEYSRPTSTKSSSVSSKTPVDPPRVPRPTKKLLLTRPSYFGSNKPSNSARTLASIEEGAKYEGPVSRLSSSPSRNNVTKKASDAVSIATDLPLQGDDNESLSSVEDEAPNRDYTAELLDEMLPDDEVVSMKSSGLLAKLVQNLQTRRRMRQGGVNKNASGEIATTSPYILEKIESRISQERRQEDDFSDSQQKSDNKIRAIAVDSRDEVGSTLTMPSGFYDAPAEDAVSRISLGLTADLRELVQNSSNDTDTIPDKYSTYKR